jgi:hypothetical protein
MKIPTYNNAFSFDILYKIERLDSFKYNAFQMPELNISVLITGGKNYHRLYENTYT